ncbi:MAG: GNAT family N-acetyltransferase [Acidimicrobiales bacterium]
MALLVPDPVAGEIDGLRRALSAPGLGRIPPHITLVPPVNVAVSDRDEAAEVVARAAKATRLPALGLGPTATFWPDNPVVYLKVNEPEGSGGHLVSPVGSTVGAEAAVATPAVSGLRSAIMSGPLHRPDSREFVAHVTIADQIDPERIPGAVQALDGYRSSVVIEAVHLLVLGPDRSWTTLADFPLGRPPVRGRGGMAVELIRSERVLPSVAEWARRQLTVWVKEQGHDQVDSFTVTARREGRVVGLLDGYRVGCDWYLNHLVVDQVCRHQGIGTVLVKEVEAMVSGEGDGRVIMMLPGPGRAERFLAGRGFVALPGRAQGKDGRDCVVMRRAVQGSP